MLVRDPQNIRLAMVGMVDGNGHPYSWSAIVNGGYDKALMAQCGYPVIPQYLGAQPPANLGIGGAAVTHIWCDDPADAQKVAAAARIPHVVDRPEAVIGQVDAVIIPTDKGHEHVRRALPFIEAGLPLFIDKPLVDSEADLQQFLSWHREGRAFLSTSAMRYAREYAALRARMQQVGQLRLITMTMAKSWERYGIHSLEAVYPFLSPGRWQSVANTGMEQANIVHLRHESEVDVLLMVVGDLTGASGYLNVYGTAGADGVRAQDTFFAFKSQLVAFVEYLRTGQPPVDFAQTVELMKIIIAGIRSRQEGGRRVPLSEITTG